MDFAKNYLQTYGWSEGMGLGKDEKGVKTAVKAKLKFDMSGIGFDPNADQDNRNQWWNQAFNRSAFGLKYQLTQTQNGIKLKDNSSCDRNIKCSEKSKKYSNFVRSQKIIDNDVKQDLSQELSKTLDFDEVFRKSKGITGHKAARIGVKMNGKLKRIEEQERNLSKKLKKN